MATFFYIILLFYMPLVVSLSIPSLLAFLRFGLNQLVLSVVLGVTSLILTYVSLHYIIVHFTIGTRHELSSSF